MCLGIPGEIVEMPQDRPDVGIVDVQGIRRAINIGLLEDVGVSCGDWVLIHVGFAMSKIDEHEARSALAFLEDLGQAYTDEMDALRGSEIE